MPTASSQLCRLDETLAAFTPELTRAYLGVRLMRAGLERHRAELVNATDDRSEPSRSQPRVASRSGLTRRGDG